MYTYKLKDSLYVNLTNRCTNNCVFCIRRNPDGMGMDLWLDKEPNAEDIVNEIPNPDLYEEIVFCGYGEPTMRLMQMIEVCKYLRNYDVKIRLNTNGHGNLIWGSNIVPQLKGYLDSVSISLNAKDAEQYNNISLPDDKGNSYAAVLEFARECVKDIDEVWITVVDVISAYDIELCRQIAEDLGARFRVRHFC